MKSLVERKRRKTLNSLVKSLTVREQQALLKALRKKVLLDSARKLDKTIRSNSVSMDEIVEEVSQSRRRNLEKSKNSN